ncbi:hypothetical protein HPP92_014078 [Vanilla planifolia]|nr:hypothetical protein HPP92_014078 [Vanilla planifolia]
MGRRRKEPYRLLLLLAMVSLAFLFPSPADAALSHGYNCSADQSPNSCAAYAFYLAGTDPSILDLTSIADLFGVSRLMVARASNLSINYELRPGQPLLIPLSCSCISNRSYAPVTYQILAGDTFYLVSTNKFGNLTSYPAVEDVNPTLVPTNLSIGVMVTFPLFCWCSRNRSQPLVTYVLQPGDSFSSIASRFGSDVRSVVDLNGREGSVSPYSTILVPISQIPPSFMRTSSSNLTSPPPPPPPSSPTVEVVKRDRKGAVIGLAIALGVSVLLWFLLLLWFCSIPRTNGEWRPSYENKGSSGDQKLLTDISEFLDKYKVFKIGELRNATADFDHSHHIHGSVYRGNINGEIFAIKKMKWNAINELKILQKVNHTNLVKLEGFCIDNDAGSSYLVYEFVENGSLHSWLHDPERARRLDWRTRHRIALDLAHGLQYIHEHTWPRVVHKDIKSSNVLLDGRMRAKIANFGLARSGQNAVTARITGTQGYVAPEYIAGGLVSTKMDVFAYGVVLLELVSGQEAVTEGGRPLWAEAEEGVFAGRVVEAGRLEGWMDAALAEQSFAMESVLAIMNIARVCLQRDPARRPTMVDVVYALAKTDQSSDFFSIDGVDGVSFMNDADLTAR